MSRKIHSSSSLKDVKKLFSAPETCRTSRESPVKGKRTKVRLMDSNEMGWLTGSCNSKGKSEDAYAEVELEDGLILRLHSSEYVIVDDAEDKQLMSSKVSRALAGESVPGDRWKVAGASASGVSHGGDLVYDLHIEALPGGRSVPAGQQLDFQMAHFHAIMRENLNHRGMRFSIVHGVGDGILKSRIRKELDEVYALRCTHLPGHSGVTVITVR